MEILERDGEKLAYDDEIDEVLDVVYVQVTDETLHLYVYYIY